ncbi:hypothetical protein VP1G_01151 [Cytospora mali]|uniref:Uncharacterized protein n=1 Tax=Cytospora mali TaxID=578113 RepID=A0A194UQ86_CYTMA|nr:hypothetical protein VP1G_01151 [Valsa mali var. pyri (nom. inval.)]
MHQEDITKSSTMSPNSKTRYLVDTRTVQTGEGAQPLQVICGGLPRCATSSLQAALEGPLLDFNPCMHMAHVAPHTDRLQLVIDCMREADTARRQKMLHRLFDGYAATTDFPGIMFLEDLMDMYPSAAIVLNTRSDARAWVRSIEDGLGFFNSYAYRISCFLWKTDRLHAVIQNEARKIYKRQYGERMKFPSVEAYYEHIEVVKEQARKRGRPLLEWRPQDGYCPLCELLGRPPPPEGTEFPRLNDQSVINFLKTVLVVRGLVSWAALGGALWVGWTYGPQLLQTVAKAGKLKWKS